MLHPTAQQYFFHYFIQRDIYISFQLHVSLQSLAALVVYSSPSGTCTSSQEEAGGKNPPLKATLGGDALGVEYHSKQEYSQMVTS